MTGHADSWLDLKDRLAMILYSNEPLSDRMNAIQAEFARSNRIGPDSELASMSRSAAGNREDPFIHVGKNLLRYCNERHADALQEAAHYEFIHQCGEEEGKDDPSQEDLDDLHEREDL